MTHFGFAMAAAHLIALSNVSAASVPEARLNPAPVQLPVVDGKGMRFTEFPRLKGSLKRGPHRSFRMIAASCGLARNTA
jgi:hypothetical protein